MPEDAELKGLHRRIEALEGRLAELEAAMVALQTAYAAASSRSHGVDEEGRLAERLGATQGAYDDALLGLRELQALGRRLRDWGLAPADTASWAKVCRALALPHSSGAHRVVRGREPVLHVLLHRCAMPSHCAIDGVTYRA